MLTAHLNLTNALVVLIRDTRFHQAGQRIAATLEFVVFPVNIGDKRCALGHAVTYGVRETDAFEKLVHFHIQRCATDDNLLDTSSESVYQCLAQFGEHDLIEERHTHYPAYRRLGYLRNDLVFINLLQDKRHSQHAGRFDLCKRFEQHFR